MALPGPLEALLRGRFGYDWRTQEVDIGGTDFMHKMSGEAREFIWLAAGSPSENKRLTLKQQYGHPWRDDPLLISRWRKLPQTAQLETLVFVMSEVHEVIHHVDFLCTPFAVNLHTKLMRVLGAAGLCTVLAQKTRTHAEQIDRVRSACCPDRLRSERSRATSLAKSATWLDELVGLWGRPRHLAASGHRDRLGWRSRSDLSFWRAIRKNPCEWIFCLPASRGRDELVPPSAVVHGNPGRGKYGCMGCGICRRRRTS